MVRSCRALPPDPEREPQICISLFRKTSRKTTVISMSLAQATNGILDCNRILTIMRLWSRWFPEVAFGHAPGQELVLKTACISLGASSRFRVRESCSVSRSREAGCGRSAACVTTRRTWRQHSMSRVWKRGTAWTEESKKIPSSLNAEPSMPQCRAVALQAMARTKLATLRLTWLRWLGPLSALQPYHYRGILVFLKSYP